MCLKERPELFPCTLRRVRGGEFLSMDEIYLEGVGKDVANSLLARSMGLDGDNTNAVLAVFYEK